MNYVATLRHGWIFYGPFASVVLGVWKDLGLKIGQYTVYTLQMVFSLQQREPLPPTHPFWPHPDLQSKSSNSCRPNVDCLIYCITT